MGPNCRRSGRCGTIVCFLPDEYGLSACGHVCCCYAEAGKIIVLNLKE
jgi:hypothetical protein